MKSKQCQYCGTVFEGRENRLYCSEKCKMAAFRNGQNGLVTETETDKPFETDTEKRLLNSFTQKKSGSLTVPVQFTPQELEMLETQAQECGVSVSKYIAIRSQMTETDTRKMEETIHRLKTENENLSVKLSFFNGKASPAVKSNPTGLLIQMNESQKKFIFDKFLESIDFDFSGCNLTLSDGTTTKNERIFLEELELKHPGAIERNITSPLIGFLFDLLEEKLIKNKGYSEEDFEDEHLNDVFDDLE